eukprot:CAMPEP_0178995872 /NCGR_PEP_ID=MMETSP0795-20121207/8055_1 /TAXON_ID=88552 /ORGANISM="Amoebophrya sp., Strain Ameob2" /LENGTH=480 /DNA_ID=CAMNT_0020688201 /DNA_START=275 /DNA_END=1717 /DNA_ORIENTATION=-
MAPTRWTLFFSATAALWCCYSITIAAAAASTPTTSELDLFKQVALAGGMYVIDLNKDGNIGAELERAAPVAGFDCTFWVRRPERVEASAIVHLKEGQDAIEIAMIVNAMQIAERNSLEVAGYVGGGWLGPVGVRHRLGPVHYAVYLFQLKAGRPVPEPPAFGTFPVRLRLPFYDPDPPAPIFSNDFLMIFFSPNNIVMPVLDFFSRNTRLLHSSPPSSFVIENAVLNYEGNGLRTLRFSLGGVPYFFYLAAPMFVADVSPAAGSTENDQRRSAPYLSPVPSPAEVDEAGTSASPPGAVEAGARLQDGWDAERQALEAKIAAMLSDHSDAEQNIRQEFQVERERNRDALEEAWAREKEAWAREKADLEKACEEQTKKAENFNKQLKAMREHRALSSEEEDVEMGDASEQGRPKPNSLRPVGFERAVGSGSTSSAGPGPTSRGGEVGGQEMLEEAETTVGGNSWDIWARPPPWNFFSGASQV